MTTALIVGHPNSGKTALFNALTHSHAAVGNWAGVTVDLNEARCQIDDHVFTLQDAPGLYSLFDHPDSEDEKLAKQTITNTQPDLLINVVDACQLARQLLLTSELLELGRPLVLVINMTPLAKEKKIIIPIEALSKALQCPVYRFDPKTACIPELQQGLISALQNPTPAIPLALPLPPHRHDQLTQLQQAFPDLSRFGALQHLYTTASSDIDMDITAARVTALDQIRSDTQINRSPLEDTTTSRLDSVLTHRFLGIPLFLAMMYSLFFFAIHVGGIFQDFFDQASTAFFIQTPALMLGALHAPSWLIELITDGIGKGLNTTLTFIPVLAAMYLGLSFLEGSGYMARAAFVMDRLMRILGLPGKAFVPLIIGFGCNVPAILATRTLERKRDRILTILMSPFMSCSARLTIYTVFVSAFFTQNGQNVIFCLYLLGIVAAILTGLMLKHSFQTDQLSPLMLELPPYHRPQFKRLFKMTYHRLLAFLIRAAKLIVPVCLCLSALNFMPSPNLHHHPLPNLLTFLGEQLTPLFAPMGLEVDNWPATVGLLTGILAKEVVIGSLNTLYHQLGHVTPDIVTVNPLTTLMNGVQSIGDHLVHLGQSFLHPLSSKTQGLSAEASHVMQQHFKSAASVYAYLTFILLYLPCISTMAAIKQESSTRLMWFSILWSFGLAYGLSVLVYQTASFTQHPLLSSSWIMGLLLAFFGFAYSFRQFPLAFDLPDTDVLTTTTCHTACGPCQTLGHL